MTIARSEMELDMKYGWYCGPYLNQILISPLNSLAVTEAAVTPLHQGNDLHWDGNDPAPVLTSFKDFTADNLSTTLDSSWDEAAKSVTCKPVTILAEKHPSQGNVFCTKSQPQLKF